jgi:hypothetical protein
VAETDDDNNVEMLDNDGVKDNEVTETGDKMATIEPVTETTSRSPSVIRLVVQWSPKDFDTLNKSRDEFNRCIAPILSAIHTPDHPLVEWQTSQIYSAAELLPSDVSRLLNIKIASSYKMKTFTFGFCIRTMGIKLKTILQSKALAYQGKAGCSRSGLSCFQGRLFSDSGTFEMASFSSFQFTHTATTFRISEPPIWRANPKSNSL